MKINRDRMKSQRTFLLLVFLAFFGISLHGSEKIVLFSNSESMRIQFAVSEIQDAMNKRDEEISIRPLSSFKSQDIGDVNIVMFDCLPNKKTGNQQDIDD